MILGEGSNQQEYPLDPADISWKEGSVDGTWCLGGLQGNDGVRLFFHPFIYHPRAASRSFSR